MTKHNKTTGSTTPGPASSSSITPETTLPAEPSTMLEIAGELLKANVKGRANIKFIGRKVYGPGKRKILSDPSPIVRYSIDGRTVHCPPADWQKRNRLFYHERAGEIVRLFPHLYKLVKTK